MFQLVITPQMYLLISLIIENALKFALDTVGKMTPEEVEAGITAEEEKKKKLMADIDAH